MYLILNWSGLSSLKNVKCFTCSDLLKVSTVTRAKRIEGFCHRYIFGRNRVINAWPLLIINRLYEKEFLFYLQDIPKTLSGDICALFGVDCSSGDTFVKEETQKLSMVSFFNVSYYYLGKKF